MSCDFPLSSGSQKSYGHQRTIKENWILNNKHFMINLIKTDSYFIMQNDINDVTKIFVSKCICIKLSRCNLLIMYMYLYVTKSWKLNMKLNVFKLLKAN